MTYDFLAGIRVLDLSQYIPGPFATRQLADMGADVIKIEPPAGDPMQGFGAPDQDGISIYYKLLNAGKTVTRLDLKTSEGKQAFERMAAKADVLMESFRPGTLDKLGFPASRLQEINPRLIHCALSGFGQTGPYRLRAGHDLTYVALAGALAAQGTKETPVVADPPLADHAGAQQAVSAILAALLGRARTGKGAYLDISLCEAALSLNYLELAASQRPEGATAREGGLINGGAAYYRIYRTQDGRFAALGALEFKFWQAFCEAAGRPELAARHSDPFPQTALILETATLFASRSLADWLVLLAQVDCCFEAVLTPAESLAHPHIQARGLTQSGLGWADIGLPVIADGKPSSPRKSLEVKPAGQVLMELS
ncbi:Acyl-CoA transferase/carnitine dehydratase [Rhodospirillaceae bacterium LM-1]|nr:Acyl-CoA transferase/carnitine dehydratase [Rhodospirillaceae bacterium LM-1]